ncbi:MAG: 16S rRNA (cytosine(1402)-N(4))-methyltransferase RsmH [Patescibacteria group bacterium]
MHVPVMLKEAMKWLDPKPNQNFIDCTLGGGGHAIEILRATVPNGKLLGIDLDKGAGVRLQSLAKDEGINPDRIIFANDNFRQLAEIVRKNNFEPARGALLDLGFSSIELEEGGLGLSFQKDEPLDMRYGHQGDLTAAEIINAWSAEDLEGIFKKYGEEKLSKQIAEKIIKARRGRSDASDAGRPVSSASGRKILTTGALRDIILEAYREKLRSKKEVPWIGGIHPATRVFQALRIAVNDEYGALKEMLPAAAGILAPSGRLVVISFHSGEDRIVKHFFRSSGLKILTKKPVLPSEAEVAANPRSRSAKMRVAEKI